MNFFDPRLPDRFWAKCSPCPMSGCWIWSANATRRGYGRIGTNRDGMKLAHRVSYQALVGAIGEGLDLDHLCRQPSCVNPGHLQPVTHAENCRRGDAGKATGRRTKSRTHCPSGHEYTEENTYTHNNKRSCRTCRSRRTTPLKEKMTMNNKQDLVLR